MVNVKHCPQVLVVSFALAAVSSNAQSSDPLQFTPLAIAQGGLVAESIARAFYPSVLFVSDVPTQAVGSIGARIGEVGMGFGSRAFPLASQYRPIELDVSGGVRRSFCEPYSLASCGSALPAGLRRANDAQRQVEFGVRFTMRY
ncbi:MAG: hypothetical protein E6R08_01080 [Nevskiaceae bacterium]|nr:MAG: hypothetical protein E6R08_01080 [Nevskiaceae bacterium]